MTIPNNPKVGDVLSREEISRIFGGNSQHYLPHKGGDVVCGCFDPLKNPKAPEEVLVGFGRDRIKYAKRLVEQNVSVPIFLKRGLKQYEFVGHFQAKKYSDDFDEVAQKAKVVQDSDKIAGVLYLEEAKER
jgi:hypothetical protein